MNVTLLATVCALLAGAGPKLCSEHRVLSTYDNPSLTPAACNMFGQAIIAQWKMNGKYADEAFTVEGYRCSAGDVQPRGDT